MVGRKENKMSVAVTSVGQVTIPKAWRDELGIKDRVEINKEGDVITITRVKTEREILEEIWNSYTPEERARIKAKPFTTMSEWHEEFGKSPEGRKYIEEWYGR